MVAVGDLVEPNGLCFWREESRLYFLDTGNWHAPDGSEHIRGFEAVDGRKLHDRQVLAEMPPEFANGIRTNGDANLRPSAAWARPGSEVMHCLPPDGELIGRTVLPEPCATLCIGGVKRNRLIIKTSQSLSSLHVEAVGSQGP